MNVPSRETAARRIAENLEKPTFAIESGSGNLVVVQSALVRYAEIVPTTKRQAAAERAAELNEFSVASEV